MEFSRGKPVDSEPNQSPAIFLEQEGIHQECYFFLDGLDLPKLPTNPGEELSEVFDNRGRLLTQRELKEALERELRREPQK